MYTRQKMKRSLKTTGIVLLLCLPTVQAADVSKGKKLVNDNCMSCHDDSVYTRKDRRVTSMKGLQKQVKRCELNLGLKWFDDDIDNVVTYLNDSYYKFK